MTKQCLSIGDAARPFSAIDLLSPQAAQCLETSSGHGPQLLSNLRFSCAEVYTHNPALACHDNGRVVSQSMPHRLPHAFDCGGVNHLDNDFVTVSLEQA